MLAAITVIHVIVCLFLVIVVLLQSGKSADIAGTFGGMGSQTAFGPRGAATALSRATTGAVVVFMLTSMSLSVLATRHAGGTSGSVLDKYKSQPAQQPKAPTVPPTQPKP